jgi:hypothetical protein
VGVVVKYSSDIEELAKDTVVIIDLFGNYYIMSKRGGVKF